MKLTYLFASLIAFATSTTSFGQDTKTVADCTITYDVSVQTGNATPEITKAMAETNKVVYIKGSRSRTDLTTPSFKQTMIYDAKTDTTVILRELGSNKYISYLDGDKRREKNKKFEGIKFTKTTEKKTILGYDCQKVVATLADGTNYDVFYTTSIVPSVTDFEYQFRGLPGFVLEYEAEFEQGKTRVKFTASKISLVPVPIARFDIPKTGYRVL